LNTGIPTIRRTCCDNNCKLFGTRNAAVSSSKYITHPYLLTYCNKNNISKTLVVLYAYYRYRYEPGDVRVLCFQWIRVHEKKKIWNYPRRSRIFISFFFFITAEHTVDDSRISLFLSPAMTIIRRKKSNGYIYHTLGHCRKTAIFILLLLCTFFFLFHTRRRRLL